MRTNTALSYTIPKTHEGADAVRIDAVKELRRSVMACLLFEGTFYESGNSTAARIVALCAQVSPEIVASLAIEARENMKLRHVPLFLVRELARQKGTGPLIAATLESVIQRADELTEFCALYWKDAPMKDGRRIGQPLTAGIKRGLAVAFRKFDAYRLSKYDRKSSVKLRDVLFLCCPKPKDAEQAAVWKKLVNGTLESPDTWEVELSAGKDKKETFERLLREKKLGGMAVLRNLRNMQTSGVDSALIRERLETGIERALPFRFITAARYAPTFEPSLETGMFRALEGLEPLAGSTGVLIDVSGSMDAVLSAKSETTRLDAACGLAILAREKCPNVEIATFSDNVVIVPARRGFALRDAILHSQAHSGTCLGGALAALQANVPEWRSLDRMIVITDEQSHDRVGAAWCPKAYMVNVGTYQNGVGYGNGWTHIDGWSERIIDYIREHETENDR